MPRKTSSLPTRLWTFAAKLVRESEPPAREIVWRSNRYYNRLVEIERERHGRYREIRRHYAPDLATCETQWEEMEDAIYELYREAKRDRQAHWRKTGGDKVRVLPAEYEMRKLALVEQQKAASAAAKPLRKAFGALIEPARAEFKRRSKERAGDAGPRTKAKINSEVLAEMLQEEQWHEAWKQIARSDDLAHDAIRDARAACGLYAGTYLSVEAAFAKAKADSAPRQPSFHRFDGEGKIQCQTKGTWAELRSAGRVLFERLTPHGRSRPDSHIYRVTFDQTRDGCPQRVVAICKLHRLPPHDAQVKWICLLVRRVGSRMIVRLQLTLEHASFAHSARPAGTRVAAHVRLGWSRDRQGIVIASWGDGERVICPQPILEQKEYAEHVESVADRLRLEAVRRLRAVSFLRGDRVDGRMWAQIVSDKHRPTLRRICAAYAQFALGDVQDRWRTWVRDRRSRGEDLYASVRALRAAMPAREALAWWCYLWSTKDSHLEQLAADSRRRFGHRRDAHYRAEAIRIATEFERVTIDRYDIAKLKELPEITMPGEGVRDLGQSQLQAAAPGRFREILLDVMGPRCIPCERPGDEQMAAGARGRKTMSLRTVADTDTSQ